ncbi:MAG: hypothetical protein HUU55_22835 [Myxococcales bacterium]|nr:hypothetical protein [Myxococcales bacterium]
MLGVRIGIVTALVFMSPALLSAAPPAAKVSGGSITVNGKKIGKSKSYKDAVVLDDGSVIAVRDSGKLIDLQVANADSGLVVRIDPSSGAERVVFEGQSSEYGESAVGDLDGVALSPDGTTLYVYGALSGVGDGAIWAMNPDGTGAKFLARATHNPAVVQSGPYRGHLLTIQRQNYETGGLWFPIVVLSPESGEPKALCRKPKAGKSSPETDLLPYLPLNMLNLDPGAPKFTE